MHGKVKSSPNRFHVNLQQGSPYQTIALHFNPRYREGGTPHGQTLVVLNSLVGSWGAENRPVTSAMRPGNHFVLSIRRQPHHYDLMVDGFLLTQYPHRITADIVDTVEIEGDVKIKSVIVM